MPIIEISRDIGRQLNGSIIEKTVLDIPDENGMYSTGIGTISITTLERNVNKIPTKVVLEGEILKGTPLKDRHRRTSRKIVSLRGGCGQQTLSKREIITVYPQRGQGDLSLGVPVVIK